MSGKYENLLPKKTKLSMGDALAHYHAINV